MTGKLQMVCCTCGSSSVSADAYARWNPETQDWEVSSTFDKGAACDVCGGETRIDEIPLEEWEKAQGQPFDFKDFTIQTFEDKSGDYYAKITHDGTEVASLRESPDWEGPLGDHEEAADAARKFVLEEFS